MEKFDTKKGEFPEEGEYVAGYVIGRPWRAQKDTQNNRFWKVVTCKRGITEGQREAMDDTNPRKGYFCPEDVFGNNKVPWCWEEFGTSEYFGQEIEIWYRLNTLEKE